MMVRDAETEAIEELNDKYSRKMKVLFVDYVVRQKAARPPVSPYMGVTVVEGDDVRLRIISD